MANRMHVGVSVPEAWSIGPLSSGFRVLYISISRCGFGECARGTMVDVEHKNKLREEILLRTLDLLLLPPPPEKIKENEVSGSGDQRLDVAVVGHEYLKEKWLGAPLLSKTTYVAYLVSSGFVENSKAKRRPSSVLEKEENRMQLPHHGRTVIHRRYR